MTTKDLAIELFESTNPIFSEPERRNDPDVLAWLKVCKKHAAYAELDRILNQVYSWVNKETIVNFYGKDFNQEQFISHLNEIRSEIDNL